MALLMPLRRVRVADTSMQPAVRPGDRLIVAGWLRPRVGDIVVVRAPQHRDTLLVKRVHVVKGGEIDVRGDNPNVSRDSRDFGPVTRELVVGRVVYRYLPGDRRGTV